MTREGLEQYYKPREYESFDSAASEVFDKLELIRPQHGHILLETYSIGQSGTWAYKSLLPSGDWLDETRSARRTYMSLGRAELDAKYHSYFPGEGANLLQRFEVLADGEQRYSGDRTIESAKKGAFGAQAVSAELFAFPRYAEFIPEWMRTALGDDWESYAAQR